MPISRVTAARHVIVSAVWHRLYCEALRHTLFAVGNDGCVLIKGCPVPEHRGFEVTLFANPYGSSDNDNDFPIRMVLSSYYIPQLLNQVSGLKFQWP